MKRYDARFFIDPPDVPDFFYKRYGVQSYRKLIDWAVKEYRQAIWQFSKRGAMKAVKFYSDVSPMYVLAFLPDMQKIFSLMTQEVWDQLTGRERVFLRRAYEIKIRVTTSKVRPLARVIVSFMGM